MKKIKTVFIIAACIALSSQVYFNLFAPGFTITLSVIVLPILLYFNREINPLYLTAIVGIASPLYRGLIMYISNTSLHQIVSPVFTDILFYFTYGMVYYFLYWKKIEANLTNFFVSAVLSDFIGNVLELSALMAFKGYKYIMFQDLVIIAFIRSTIAVGVILLFRYYSFLLVREEHEKRYRKLILITSKIKSEVYFMNKNKTDIEGVMKKAYYLYKTLSENNYPVEFQNASLDVAKDVHEIKKDYASVIKGLEEIFDKKYDNVKMNIKDIMDIVEADVKEHIRRNKLNVYLDFKIYDNFSVEKHYYLVSIIRNLIYNSIESMEKRKNGYIRIVISKRQGECIFVVSDNGSGIKKKDLAYVFNPGFSTKFNKETGDICRGIGLTHVNGIVTDIFKGSISVVSEEKKGTEFTIKIKEEKIEGDQDEILCCR
ncbi:GHKL domain-containing protein [Clostridium autoethanogenum]|uniref:GHKL domain-containing protein n=2 Tax=Clostridium TaxID=1485 RepID=A0A3M0S022_9CLOT|nr:MULTISPECIES: ATP-binding protein [Clostridium]ADK15861.1 putative membrane-bound ATPase [Clostridium ljungdahlii DSM 13528]OAA84269.1 Sensor histidine kinase GlnK [Clostridium ljungdahlii DSM 13528]RMC91849.1 GHKL domain-containing protein [Clostridium autoethanogenum]